MQQSMLRHRDCGGVQDRGCGALANIAQGLPLCQARVAASGGIQVRWRSDVNAYEGKACFVAADTACDVQGHQLL